MKRKSKGRLEGSCVYQCDRCGDQEEIPEDVLECFDAIDPGLPGQPATFECQRCPGIMYPEWWFESGSQKKR
jgi:uncharacterized Zn finger protein